MRFFVVTRVISGTRNSLERAQGSNFGDAKLCQFAVDLPHLLHCESDHQPLKEDEELIASRVLAV
jgi:hypothetical protein